MNALFDRADLDPIATFFPWESDDRQLARRRLYNARNVAAVRAQRCSAETARELFWIANEIAARWCFSEWASAEQFVAVTNSLEHLFRCAGGIEDQESENARCS